MTGTIGTRRFAILLLLGGVMACGDGGLNTPTSATPSSASTSDIVAAMAASTCATGDGVNDACSCDADARTHCSGFYSADWQSYARANGYTTSSWKYGLLDCLGAHTVAAACAASLDRREALNAQMMSACARYCRGTTPRPGAEPCVDQLKSLYDTLDVACRLALDAHEAAKAIAAPRP